jgi:hypothetical protein
LSAGLSFFVAAAFLFTPPNKKIKTNKQSQTAIHDMMPPMKQSHNLRVYDFRFSALPEGISSIGEKSAQLEVRRVLPGNLGLRQRCPRRRRATAKDRSSCCPLAHMCSASSTCRATLMACA